MYTEMYTEQRSNGGRTEASPVRRPAGPALEPGESASDNARSPAAAFSLTLSPGSRRAARGTGDVRPLILVGQAHGSQLAFLFPFVSVSPFLRVNPFPPSPPFPASPPSQ